MVMGRAAFQPFIWECIMKNLKLLYCVLIIKTPSNTPELVVGNDLSRKEATTLSKSFSIPGRINKIIKAVH
jgi:hypothetical protein